MIDTEKKAYPISLLCSVMQVTRSGYYSWRTRGKSARQHEYEKLIPVVQEAHRIAKETYGTRRIVDEAKAVGVSCGREKAKTLMKLANVSAKQKRKFKVDEPDRAYVSDITYIWTSEGWLYLAIVLDLYSRRIVGWSLNNRMSRTLVMDALRMAIWRRQPAPGLIFHSDRGSQYCSDDFQKMLKTYGMVSSMSRKGNCWDNSVAESFFGSLKTERVFFTNYTSRNEAKRDIVDYIEMFYNCKRRHSYMGSISPRDFEKLLLLKKAA